MQLWGHFIWFFSMPYDLNYYCVVTLCFILISFYRISSDLNQGGCNIQSVMIFRK